MRRRQSEAIEDAAASAASDAQQTAQQIPGKTIDAEVKKETNRS